MPYRRLPGTDEQRLLALQIAANKSEITDANHPLSNATIALLVTFLPQFARELYERGMALRSQAEGTTAKDIAKARAQMICSHFLQVFYLGITRGAYRVADKAFYQIDINQESLPPLSSDGDLLIWLERIVQGETARVNADGNPMTNPAITEVINAKQAFDNAMMTSSTKKDEYDKESEDVEKLRNQADSLIREIWDEVEFAFRHSDDASRRRKAREWGVVYVSRPGEESEEGVLPEGN